MKIVKRRRDGKVQSYNFKVERLAWKIEKGLKPLCYKVGMAGSIRRHKPANDIDIVIIPKDKELIRRYARKIGKVLADGEQQIFLLVQGVRVDFFYAGKDDFGAQMMTRTGPAGANIWHRTTARKKGWILNQYGLFDKKSGKRIAVTEQEIYHKLGLSYRRPELRGSPR